MMKKTKFKVADVTSLTNWTLSVDVYNGDTRTTTTTSLGDISSIMQEIITRKYNNRYFYYTGSQPSITPTTAFNGLWANYKILKQESINAVYMALVSSHYDPCENVFEWSQITNEYGDMTTTNNMGKVKTTLEHGEVDSHSTQGKPDGSTLTGTSNTTTNYATSYDHNGVNPTEYEQGKSISNSDPVKTINHSEQGDDTSTTEQVTDGEASTTRGDDVITSLRHGNVGTVSSIDMILKEIKGRKTSFYNWLATDFMNEYTYYNNLDED